MPGFLGFCDAFFLPLSRYNGDDGCEQSGSEDRLNEFFDGMKLSCFQAEAAGRRDEGFTASNGNSHGDDDGGGSCEASSATDTWRSKNLLGSSSQESSQGIDTKFSDGFPSPRVKISPPSLDWGIAHLFSPSKIFLTVTNNHSDSSLLIHEPFSSDPQFYPSGPELLSLAPGEATNRGGFIIHARGTAVESPYRFQPLVGFEAAPDGSLRKALSMYNPLDDDDVQVEEVRAWVSVFFENGSHSAQVICQRDQSPPPAGGGGALNSKRWFSLEEAGSGEFLVGLKPHRSWELQPHSTETLMEISLFSSRDGNFSGAICVKLHSSLHGRNDTVVVPLEAQVRDGAADLRGPGGSISVFFEPALPLQRGRSVFSLSIRNGDSHPLRLEKVIEVTDSVKLFEIKSMEGLILYPGAVTLVALVVCSSIADLMEISTSSSMAVSLNCKLAVVTNHSISPKIEILCRDLVQSSSNLGSEHSFEELVLQREGEKSTDARTGSVGNAAVELLPIKRSLLEARAIDELMVDSWRSQATMEGVSVLEHQELIFPTVQAGEHLSRWIKVRNPTQKPVLIQLMLNSAVIVDRCHTVDFPSEHKPLTGYGFLVAEGAVVEALVPPLGTAELGPVDFRSKGQCRWRSSALVRSNLSGVEWVLLRAAAGAPPLILLEGSKPVDELVFDLNLPPPDLNVSSSEPPPSDAAESSSRSYSCSRLFSKEIYAKNVGESAVEVVEMDISGNGYGFEGFLVDCLGFVLEPGESTRLLIFFRPDFSSSSAAAAAVVRGYLRLVMAGGVLEIPLKAALPLAMFRQCGKPAAWWRRPFSWRYSLFVLLVAAVAVAGLLRRLPPPTTNQRKSSSRSPAEEERKPEAGGDAAAAADRKTGIRTQQVKTDSDRRKKKTRSSSPSPSSSTGRRMELAGGAAGVEGERSGSLTIQAMKERSRRRRRRGTAARPDVSGSQSGNSSPSSPLSPEDSATGSTFANGGSAAATAAGGEKALESPPEKPCLRPVLLPSATFPGAGRRGDGGNGGSTPMALDARAPGSRLRTEKTAAAGEGSAGGEEFVYDIWGNHFCHRLIGRTTATATATATAADFADGGGDSQSFFVRDPETLMMMAAPARSGARGQEEATASGVQEGIPKRFLGLSSGPSLVKTARLGGPAQMSR
ncbi:unnamed protein product [Spirodela intermedia]|uniref:Uncharacterized protein n=1 Tax=Spirodela intermedia TaxID=51605 RepID=A0A7I8KDK6_SPIIN|nr:unnamed protein product [Spirodela intermedia]